MRASQHHLRGRSLTRVQVVRLVRMPTGDYYDKATLTLVEPVRYGGSKDGGRTRYRVSRFRKPDQVVPSLAEAVQLIANGLGDAHEIEITIRGGKRA